MNTASQIDLKSTTGTGVRQRKMRILESLASLDKFGLTFLRVALIVVLLWIGGLKFAPYEADSIVPLVTNSPALRFMYSYPAPEYHHYMNREGENIPAHRAWQEHNGTYRVSDILGVVIISIGVLIALRPFLPEASAIGSLLLILMSFTTLSFLITTPEVWVPNLGAATHGFPYLSGGGRLIIKDLIMLGAAVVTLADSAKAALRRLQT